MLYWLIIPNIQSNDCIVPSWNLIMQACNSMSHDDMTYMLTLIICDNMSYDGMILLHANTDYMWQYVTWCITLMLTLNTRYTTAQECIVCYTNTHNMWSYVTWGITFSMLTLITCCHMSQEGMNYYMLILRAHDSLHMRTECILLTLITPCKYVSCVFVSLNVDNVNKHFFFYS